MKRCKDHQGVHVGGCPVCVEAQLIEARKVLGTFEWDGWNEKESRRCCPKCGAIEYRERHDNDCALAAVLKESE